MMDDYILLAFQQFTNEFYAHSSFFVTHDYPTPTKSFDLWGSSNPFDLLLRGGSNLCFLAPELQVTQRNRKNALPPPPKLTKKEKKEAKAFEYAFGIYVYRAQLLEKERKREERQEKQTTKRLWHRAEKNQNVKTKRSNTNITSSKKMDGGSKGKNASNGLKTSLFR